MQINQEQIKSGLHIKYFNLQLNILRKFFKKDIKSLIPYRDINNNLSLRLSLLNNFYYFSIPENLVMNQADWDQMKSLIKVEIEDVSQRN